MSVAASIFRALRPGNLIGPILDKELRISSRRRRMYVLRVCYLLLMNKGVDFTQETTLSGIKTSQTISRARRRGYYIRLYYVGLETVEESIARIRIRAENGGHYIPDEDVVRRFNFRYANLMRILPQCDEVHFYDNCNGFIEVARVIDGQLLFRGTVTPKWMVELSAYIQRAKDSNRM